jgi:hypothetical protein
VQERLRTALSAPMLKVRACRDQAWCGLFYRMHVPTFYSCTLRSNSLSRLIEMRFDGLFHQLAGFLFVLLVIPQ